MLRTKSWPQWTVYHVLYTHGLPLGGNSYSVFNTMTGPGGCKFPLSPDKKYQKIKDKEYIKDKRHKRGKNRENANHGTKDRNMG